MAVLMLIFSTEKYKHSTALVCVSCKSWTCSQKREIKTGKGRRYIKKKSSLKDTLYDRNGNLNDVGNNMLRRIDMAKEVGKQTGKKQISTCVLLPK
jgi:hypothetical protein